MGIDVKSGVIFRGNNFIEANGDKWNNSLMRKNHHFQKKRSNAGIRRFHGHVEKFMHSVGLMPTTGKAYVAVSGGADSIALLSFMHSLKKAKKINHLSILHINHLLRPSAHKDERRVRNLAKKLGVPLIVERVDLAQTNSNLEARAREARLEVFDRYLQKGDRLYQGHHLDDSFEWWLLNQLRSSHAASGLGIPVRNKQVCRPFLAVTRAQIRTYLKLMGLAYSVDESNYDNHFERNFLRNLVLPHVYSRFPQFLKLYAYRSNALARVQRKHLGAHQDGGDGRIAKRVDSLGVIELLANRSSAFADESQIVLRELHRASPRSRGSYYKQLEKLEQARCHHQFGPLSFPGQVEVFPLPLQTGILTSVVKRRFALIDETYSQKIKESQIPEAEYSLDEFRKVQGNLSGFFPGWACSSDQKLNRLLPGHRRVHPLWPKLTSYLLRQKWWFRTQIELIYYWERNPYFKQKKLSLIV